MPQDQQVSDIPEATKKLYGLAVDLAKHGMFCRCCAMVWTRRNLDTNHDEIIDAFISYRDKPINFRHLEKNAMIGHALILRALGSDAANRIGQAYIDWGSHATELCTALLIWVGDNPELAEVGEKITLHPEIANRLLDFARGRLTQRIRISNPAYELRQRLSAEMLSQCQVPDCVQLALNQDMQTVGGALTKQILLSELQYISDHLGSAQLQHRVDSLLRSIVANIDE